MPKPGLASGEPVPVRKSIRKAAKCAKAESMQCAPGQARPAAKTSEGKQAPSSGAACDVQIKDHDVDHVCENLLFGEVDSNAVDLLGDLQDQGLQDAANQAIHVASSPSAASAAAAEHPELLWHLVATPAMMKAFAQTVPRDSSGRSVSVSG